MKKCPKCYSIARQKKAGQTQAGSQRYRCMFWGCKYTLVKKRHGYDPQVRKQAIQLYVDRFDNHMNLYHPVRLQEKVLTTNTRKK